MNSTIPDSIPYEVEGFTLTEAQRAKLAAGKKVVIEISESECLMICGAEGQITHRRLKGSYERVSAIAEEVDDLFDAGAGIKAPRSRTEPK